MKRRAVSRTKKSLSFLCRLILLIATFHWSAGHAGGGPENVLVVVNENSPLSLEIANFYVKLRDIPPEHVLWLHDIPYPDTITIDTFRRRILQPISEFISRNRLEKAIDIIAYSADFPYAVDFSHDRKIHKLPKEKYRGRVASLTGLTYFARRVANRDPYYVAANGNRYFRRKLSPQPHLPREATKVESQMQREAEKALRNKQFQTAVEHIEKLVQSFPEHGGFRHELARAYAAAGHPALAMDALEQAVNHGWTNSLQTRSDPYFTAIRENSRFRRLLLRMEQGNGPFQSAHGFSSQYEWTGANQPLKPFSSDSLNSYYLSTLLAYTGSYGNSVPEIRHYLDSAAASDGTRPDGTVYLLVNHDVRSKTRQPLFLETVAELEKRGRRAEILRRGDAGQDGILPRNKGDVIGAVVGSANFSWKSSGSRLLPGAIAESLTSYGGRLEKGAQTKLTEFLRYGAAGSSGTVAEPFSIQAKFPVPLLHVYFADGCSLAEAFYQSVEAPYQLLVVGDPLARPFARFAGVRLSSPDPQHVWSGVVTLKPDITPVPGRPLEEVELWVDGQLTAYALPDAPILWDTRTVDDGYHDVRLVAVESDAVETRSYRRLAVTVANTGHRLEVDATASTVRYGETFTVSGSAPGGNSIAIWQGKRLLVSAPVTRGHWRVRITTPPLGIGPVALVARATFADQSVIRSAPLHLEVRPPRIRTAAISAEAQDTRHDTAPEGTDQSEGAAKPVRLDGRLGKLPGGRRLALSGQFMIHQSGFYELVVNASGELSLDIDGSHIGSFHQTRQNQPAFIPLGLAAGRHHLAVEYRPRDNRPFLKIILEGDQQPLNPEVRLIETSPAG